MKYIMIPLLICIQLFSFCSTKSQDYARHIELSLLFYECQRSGKLPETNRIYWRHDSMLEAGKDVGIDLTGGYYDAGDNVKYNFPGASSMTLLAWSGIEFEDAYKEIGQWKYLLDTVKWGTDYFIKCHPEKNILYVGVGNGEIDHSLWYPPEYVQYEYPAYKVDEENPGSEVAAETASCLAAASILFKEEDPSYSSILLKHAKELYDFADTYRGSYADSVPSVLAYYNSFSGYMDELAWGASWLFRSTGEEQYLEKYNAIADKKYDVWDPKKFTGCTGPISWDDKRPGAYILMAQNTGEEKRLKEAYDYCDEIISQPKTPGGLYYDKDLSVWASNRYAANAASMVAICANMLEKGEEKQQKYIDFVKSQIDYILGDNPQKINYVVGAEVNSPKSVHHRGASSTYDCSGKPPYNVFTLYGALAGGPGGDDSYKDSRSNFQMNEVALDYNAGFTLDLAALIHFGYGKKDSGEILDFDRAWPPKPPTPDITVSLNSGTLSISTGSGMLCSSWCILIGSNCETSCGYNANCFTDENSNNVICNGQYNNFLDGKGTPQTAPVSVSGCSDLTKYDVLCDGFYAPNPQHKIVYKPEYGHKYLVSGSGGPENTKPLFEETNCWPSFLCS